MNKFFFLFLLLISCINKDDLKLKDSIIRQYPRVFKSYHKVFFENNIKYTVELRSNKVGDTLLLATLIENKSEKTILENPNVFQIASSKLNRSDIVWSNFSEYKIKPKAIDTIICKFSPINNLDLYSKTGYKGDLDSVYYITSAYFDKKIKFTLDSTIYKKYVENYAVENKIKKFQFKDRNSLRYELIQDLNNSNSNKKESTNKNDITILNNEISIDGFIIKLDFYSLDSNLYLNAKFVNHGNDFLKLDLSKFIIKTKNNLLKPQVISIQNSVSQIDNNYYLVRGGRLEMKLKYKNIDYNDFLLLNEGINYVKGKSKLFKEPIQFVVDN